MQRFTACAAGFTLALAALSPAMAAPPGGPTAPAATARQVVMWCDSGAMARRAYEREHGQAPVFVTADQVLAAHRSGQTWDAPRCMTSREHARLSRTLDARKGA